MCSTQKLHQLEFVVKSISRCDRPEDSGCCSAVGIRICDHPEQTVCDVPTGVSRSGGPCAAMVVDAGRTFTFSLPAEPGGRRTCGPRPVRLAVRLYRMAGSVRTELASGELEVMTKESNRGAAGCDDHTVSLTDCPGGRTVAVLSVRARAWAAGTVTSATVEPLPPSPCSPRGCGGRMVASVPGSPCAPDCPKNECPKRPAPCCGAFVREPSPPRRSCPCAACARRS